MSHTYSPTKMTEKTVAILNAANNIKKLSITGEDVKWYSHPGIQFIGFFPGYCKCIDMKNCT